MAGSFLPIQLIYQGKTKLSQAKYNFPNEFHTTQTLNHWADENTSIEMIKKILIPNIKWKPEELNVPNKPWLLICDIFKGHWTKAVKNVNESSSKMFSVPNNWTNYFQRLNLIVNKNSKDFVCKEAQSRYSQEIIKQMEARKPSNQIKVDVRVSVVKPLHAKRIIKYYGYTRTKP